MQMITRTTRHTQLKDVGTPHVADDLSEAMLKIYDQTVSGGAVTSVQFTGLDLETDGTYFIVVNVTSAVVPAVAIYLEVNGDTTATNYYTQYLIGNGAGVSGSRVNSPQIGYLGGTGQNFASHVFLSKNAGEEAHGNIIGCRPEGGVASVQVQNASWCTTSTTNVTSIEVISSQAGGFANGSRLILYQIKS